MSAVSATPTPRRKTDSLRFTPVGPQNWKLAKHREVGLQYSIHEFIREGDEIHNWKELFTVQNFLRKSRGFRSPEETLDGLKAVREKECPGVTEWNVIDKKQDSILYEWQTTKAPLGQPEQHELARIIYGEYNVFILHYAAKVHPLPPDTRAEWIKSLSEAAISGSR